MFDSNNTAKTTADRPGGELGRRPLHFIWIVDCSGSMSVDGKIQSLNNAVKEAIPHMRDVARENPFAEILVRVLKFDSGASWQVVKPTPVDQFSWQDLSASGATRMGRALEMLAEELDVERIGGKGFPPVLALVSDGQPTDDFAGGLRMLMSQPWGKRANRVAIGIGRVVDEKVLKEFIGNPEIPVLQANNPEALKNHIRVLSTVAVKVASAPPSQVSNGSSSGMGQQLGLSTANDTGNPGEDVW